MTKSLAAFTALTLMMAAAVAMMAFSARKPDPSKSVIGIPDDTGGLLVHHLLRQEGLPFEARVTRFESYMILDCCSSTAEWALSGDLLEVAVICPDAATRLIEKDSRFKILGPCLYNSQVLLSRSGNKVTRLGIAQRRERQKELLKPLCNASCSLQPMLPTSLPYAYERGILDGAVIDFIKGTTMEGERISLAEKIGDQITYVLVVRKEWEGTIQYRQFLNLLDRAVTDLENPEILIRAVAAFKGISWTTRETDEWKRLKIRFVVPGAVQG